MTDEEIRRAALRKDDSGEPLWKRRDFICPSDFIRAVKAAQALLEAIAPLPPPIEPGE